MASLHYLDTGGARGSTLSHQLTHASTMREKVFEHLLLGELGLELMARGVEFEVLHGETDRNGFDVLVEAGGIPRHMQLKVTIAGGARADVDVNVRLSDKPSGCVVWLTFDPVLREFSGIRWFGARPGQPLPDPGSRIARHTRANADGIKAERPFLRRIAASRFEQLEDVAQLADRLFGRLPAAPLALLRSRLRTGRVGGAGWANRLDESFTAIPHDFRWNEAAPLADLLDGYRLLDLIEGDEPGPFLERQRAAQRIEGRWPGDAIALWVTLFLEARADRFGANDYGNTDHLDLLCGQLRSALIALETADA